MLFQPLDASERVAQIDVRGAEGESELDPSAHTGFGSVPNLVQFDSSTAPRLAMVATRGGEVRREPLRDAAGGTREELRLRAGAHHEAAVRAGVVGAIASGRGHDLVRLPPPAEVRGAAVAGRVVRQSVRAREVRAAHRAAAVGTRTCQGSFGAQRERHPLDEPAERHRVGGAVGVHGARERRRGGGGVRREHAGGDRGGDRQVEGRRVEPGVLDHHRDARRQRQRGLRGGVVHRRVTDASVATSDLRRLGDVGRGDRRVTADAAIGDALVRAAVVVGVVLPGARDGRTRVLAVEHAVVVGVVIGAARPVGVGVLALRDGRALVFLVGDVVAVAVAGGRAARDRGRNGDLHVRRGHVHARRRRRRHVDGRRARRFAAPAGREAEARERQCRELRVLLVVHGSSLSNRQAVTHCFAGKPATRRTGRPPAGKQRNGVQGGYSPLGAVRST